MPQPLSRVVPNGVFLPGPETLNDKPELAKLVASIFAHWAAIEQWLSLILVRILGADAEPAIAMFSTLTAQHLQMGALDAAAKAGLTADEYDVFLAVIEVTDSVQTPRNHLAHWTWGSCLGLSDALCLAEPKAQKERDRQMILALQKADKGRGVNLAALFKLGLYDPDTVMVYRKGDLERANRDLDEADGLAFALTVYFDGIFTGQRDLGARQDLKTAATVKRAELFQQLYEKRLFREAWDRIRAGRQNNPQTPHGLPPTAPNS